MHEGEHHDQWTWEDFMPGAVPRGRRQTVEEQMAQFQGFAELHRKNGHAPESPDTAAPIEDRIARARERYKANG